MWFSIILGFLASTGVVWLLVIWPIAMATNPTDPDQFVLYLIVTLVASAALVLAGGMALMALVQKVLRWL